MKTEKEIEAKLEEYLKARDLSNYYGGPDPNPGQTMAVNEAIETLKWVLSS